MKKMIHEIIQESKKSPERWIPYLMLVLLLGLAFVLPIYAVHDQAKQSSGSNRIQNAPADRVKQTKTNECTSETQIGKAQTGNEVLNSLEMQTEKVTSQTGKGTIVLDPGHGGFDNGMVGSSGISEKILNLVYAKKLAVLLEAKGYRVILTRETEEGLYDADVDNKKAQDMQRRCALIEKEKPLLTVSIHQNSYPSDSSVRGPQVFYYEHSADGEQLAACIQECMNEQLEVARPRLQKANGSYYILKRSASVTALVEMGFLTNPDEELLLQEEEYQNKAVQAVCDGIMKYLEE